MFLSLIGGEELVDVFGNQGRGGYHKGIAGAHYRSEDGGEEDAEDTGEDLREKFAGDGAEYLVGFNVFASKIDDGGDAGEAPGDGAEAFYEGAAHKADAALDFGLAGGAVAHSVGLGDDADEAVEGNDDDVEEAYFGRGDEGEHLRVPDGLFYPMQPPYRVQDEGQKEEGKNDGQDTLDEVGYDCRTEASCDAVDDEYYGHNSDGEVRGEQALCAGGDDFA